MAPASNIDDKATYIGELVLALLADVKQTIIVYSNSEDYSKEEID